jgi:hypothetical protein
LPKNDGNSYIDSHIRKLDKQLENMSKLNEQANVMARTITNMDAIKRMSAPDSQIGHPRTKEDEYGRYQYIQKYVSEHPESQMMRTGMRSGYKQSMISGNDQEASQNFKKQNKFEKSVIATLPQEYNNAKLIEITESSYLIRNEVRLPILGKRMQLLDKQSNKRDNTNLMQSINWKKGSRPVTQSTTKEVKTHKHHIRNKDSVDLKTDQAEELEKLHGISNREDASYDRLDLEIPRIGEGEYEKIQDQNHAIKRLIITVDNMINNYNQPDSTLPEKGDLEFLIQEEISNEYLLSDNEKKTIEVLVLDYFRHGKSVLNLIRLDKLEEDLKSQDNEDEAGSNGDYDQVNANMLWKLPDTEHYMELIAQRIPNKYETINEIKYKIPMKWTKKFNVDDIVPHKDKLQSAIASEGGMVNNYMKIKRKNNIKKRKVSGKLSESVQPPQSPIQTGMMQDISTPRESNAKKIGETKEEADISKNPILSDEESKVSPRYNETDGFSHLKKNPIFSNEIDAFNVPLSNAMLKESLSSKQESPRNLSSLVASFPKPGQSEETKTLLQKQKQHVSNLPVLEKIKDQDYHPHDVAGTKIINEMHIQDDGYQNDFEPEDNANLTDHDIVIDRNKGLEVDYDKQIESPRTEAQYEASEYRNDLDYSQIKPLYKPDPYNIDEIEHLFIDGKIPEEIYNIEDPMEYNYLLVKLKKEFNDKTRSEFLKYMGLSLPYNSRRDEVGGVITDDDWGDFIDRVHKMIGKVKRKRRRIIRRRRKNGKKLMPRKTLFKPRKKPDLSKNPLWKEVFLDESSDDSTHEDTDIFYNDEKLYVISFCKSNIYTILV